jgi:hypothetical protein
MRSCAYRVLVVLLAAGCADKGGDDTDTDGIDTEVEDTEVEDTDVDTDVQTTDADGDGLDDDTDPTPSGSDVNVLNSTFSGGHAEVVVITGYDATDMSEDTDQVYEDDLSVGCDDSWYPQGSLCDEPPGQDDATLSTRSVDGAENGATWDNPADFVGVLIVDACHDGGCTRVDFGTIAVFQQFSDGKTTQVRVSTHPSTGDTAPAWDDAGWTPTSSGWIDVGAGTVATFDTDSEEPVAVADPGTATFSPSVATRWVRIEAKNDGSLGDEGYIELRAIKAFGAPAVE